MSFKAAARAEAARGSQKAQSSTLQLLPVSRDPLALMAPGQLRMAGDVALAPLLDIF